MKVKLNPTITTNYPIHSLTLEKVYYVVEVDNETLRIIDDKREPILFPIELFEIVDNKIDSDWVIKLYSEGQFSLCSVMLAEPYFFEELFDYKENAIQIWQAYLKQINFETL